MWVPTEMDEAFREDSLRRKKEAEARAKKEAVDKVKKDKLIENLEARIADTATTDAEKETARVKLKSLTN